MAIKNFGRIGVLMGGPSSERKISLKSGTAVFEALSAIGQEAVAIDITTADIVENIELLKSHHLDCAFIALHGSFGEDGAIQEILEKIDLPYTGSGVKASRLAMDKIKALEIFTRGGLVVPRSSFLKKSIYEQKRDFKNTLGLPLVVKPANHGSSLGLSIVDSEAQILEAIDLAFKYDEWILLEEYISGRELTVGILGDRVLPVIEIIPQHKFFDYEAKYQSELTNYIVPAHLEAQVASLVQEVAKQAHKLLGCFGCSRTDIMLDKNNQPYILEVNTIPGMTSTSLLPKAAKVVGIDFGQLCLKLLELAYAKTKV